MDANKSLFAADERGLTPKKATSHHGGTETRRKAKTFGRECMRIKAFLPQMNAD
jgi:hypothetical protein